MMISIMLINGSWGIKLQWKFKFDLKSFLLFCLTMNYKEFVWLIIWVMGETIMYLLPEKTIKNQTKFQHPSSPLSNRNLYPKIYYGLPLPASWKEKLKFQHPFLIILISNPAMFHPSRLLRKYLAVSLKF